MAVQLHDVGHAERTQELPALFIWSATAVDTRRDIGKVRDAVHHRSGHTTSHEPTVANYNGRTDQFCELDSHGGYWVWGGVV